MIFWFTPVGIGTLIFSSFFILGLTGDEGQVHHYFTTLWFLFLFLLGGLLGCEKAYFNFLYHGGLTRSNPLHYLEKIFIFIFIVCAFVAFMRILQIIVFLTQGLSLREVERVVRFGGVVGSILVQIMPIIGFALLLSSRGRLFVIISLLCLMGAFAIPIKTHVIASLVLISVAIWCKDIDTKYKYMLIVLPVFLLFSLLFAVNLLRGHDQSDFDFLLLIRHYTSFNIGNLALEIENVGVLAYTYGIHTFSQIIDLWSFLLTGERFIDREIGNSGLNSVVDGRVLIRVVEGVNMSTSVTPWLWDFGLIGAPLFSFLYGYILNKFTSFAIKYGFKLLIGVFYLCGVFFFWDFDLFETRFQFIYIISLIVMPIVFQKIKFSSVNIYK